MNQHKKWDKEIAEVFALFEKSKNEKQKIEILKTNNVLRQMDFPIAV